MIPALPLRPCVVPACILRAEDTCWIASGRHELRLYVQGTQE
jgi:hypothetical protein